MVIPAVLLAACGGSDPEAGPTSIGDSAPAATDAPVASTATTAPVPPTSTATSETTPSPDTAPDTIPAPTVEDLTAILPTAEEVGPGFAAVEPAPQPAEGGGILNEESLALCPALAQVLLEADADTSEDAQALFVDSTSTRTVQVQVGLEPDSGDPAAEQDSYDGLITAIESCPIINAEVPGVGLYSTFPAVERVDGLGDASMHLALNGFLANEALATELNYSIYFWDRGNVSAAVVAVSGLDEQNQTVLFDEAEVMRVVTAFDSRLAELVG